MRVQCLPSSILNFSCNFIVLTIISILFALRLQETIASPSPALSPMLPSDLANLKRSIEALREAVGNSIDDAALYLSPTQNQLNRDTIYGRYKGDSTEAAGILNVKADIRTIKKADMERADADLDSEERPMLADRVSSHKSRHFKHRRRKKSCVASRYGHKQMLCPSRSSHHYDVCITSEQLCDDNIDCPGGEDENAINCLFYKSTKEQLKHIYNTVLLLADHATKQNSHREL